MGSNQWRGKGLNPPPDWPCPTSIDSNELPFVMYPHRLKAVLVDVPPQQTKMRSSHRTPPTVPTTEGRSICKRIPSVPDFGGHQGVLNNAEKFVLVLTSHDSCWTRGETCQRFRDARSIARKSHCQRSA